MALATRRRITYFRVAATVLTALSLVTPLTIPGPGSTMLAVMAVMQAPLWATSVWGAALGGSAGTRPAMSPCQSHGLAVFLQLG